MDPDATLDELLTLAEQVLQLSDHSVALSETDLRRLAELVDALNGWITAGGYLPRRWVAA